ncbi:MAG: Xaa-Pro aminopeptidase [Dokdonella sp.]|nr:MAG: Xaa-Pro aminopeptidase [Gammaproteobacteria bacterium]TXI74543.1 MAG: Xaa-Pro aminopeptidase [Dokdonella sp.]
MNRVLDAREFARRRRQLMRMAGRDAIIIVPSAAERVRNNDAHYPFRQDSDFHYLTGFAEPDAVLALVPGRSQGEVILFCRERDRAREQWDGHRAGQEGAVADFGMDDAFPIDDIDDILPGLIEGRSRVYYHFGRETRFDLILMGWVNRVRSNIKQGAKPPHEFVALSHLLHDLRLYKSRSELRLMRKSAQIAAEAHVRAMRTTRPGMNENEVEAELLHTFRKHNAVPSYEPIVGGGTNACVLHYRANNATLQDGDLLLIDAGAEYACYASDITRTFPVNGRFTPEQRELYDIVLAAQLAAIEEVRPGKSFEAYHLAAVRVLTQGLIRLGLLKGSLRSNLESHSYRKFYMHKTGHWLGLDVHDVGDYRVDGEFRELEPGMVVTVEPGLYISPDLKGVPARYRGIGIRIEDDVIVTSGEPEVISAGVPKDADEIEALMALRPARESAGPV